MHADDDELARRTDEAVKQRAVSEGRTVTSIVEQALRGYLTGRPSEVVDLPFLGDPAASPLVDLGDHGLLKELAYGADEEHLRQYRS